MRRVENRMNTMSANGIDTGKYFSLKLSTDMLDGKKIVLSSKGNDIYIEQIMNEIESGGYIANDHMFRKWICAQMLRNLRKIERGHYNSYDDMMKTAFNLKRIIRVMTNEVNAIANMQRDGDTLAANERAEFWSQHMIMMTYNYLIIDLGNAINNAKEHIQNRNELPFKQKVYIKIGTANIYKAEAVDDYKRLMNMTNELEECNGDYKAMLFIMGRLNGILLKSAYNRVEFKVPVPFRNAYKGAGAYYTLQNLVLFHNCEVTNYETAEVLKGTEAWDYVKANYLCGEAYKIFALMKRVIETNHVTLASLCDR